MITVTPPAAAQILQSAGGAGLRLAARLDDKGVIAEKVAIGIDAIKALSTGSSS